MNVLLRRFRFVGLVVLGLVAVAGCRTASAPTEPPEAPAADATPQAISIGPIDLDLSRLLLQCTPLPYARVERVIGPAGGVLSVGPHVLTVPPGALDRPVAITAELPSDRVSSVRLSPHGLEFAPGRPARLSLSYAHCQGAGILLPKRIAYITESLDLIALLRSIDNPFQRRVSAELEHFSRYAVAW
ncbi:MAG TPA: hypothetical protein VNK43_08305 [Gemmatimonadales bacterium]|nr:hypothetical protein [Gemmatimonadales bacterium]